MPARATLALTLLIAAAVVVLAPTAVLYGGIAWWGPWLTGGGAVLAAGLALAHARRTDRQRTAFYLPTAVAIGCALFTTWMCVQRLA